MPRRRVKSRVLVVSGLLAVAVLSPACSRPGGPDAINSEFPGASGGGTGGAVGIKTNLTCTPATSSQSLPARVTVINQAGSGSLNNTYFTKDLFVQFKSVCGGCHVDGSLGGFNVTESTFAQQVTESVLVNHIESNSDMPPNQYMPPAESANGMPFDQRDPTDPVKVLAQLLEIWISQNSPDGSFTLPDSASTSVTAQYALSEQLGSSLTNLGSCIPSPDMVGMNGSAMDQLDTFFAQATELPSTLEETDLVSLDSTELAKDGVISFAPGYPLWTDDAYKMRYVRVPRNQSIAFDKATQSFKIPPNTRFYKTFLRKIIDVDGSATYRKIETRLIVSRPDQDNADGTVTQTALYGTYIWNSDETQAVLLKDPLRNGKPFIDRLITYIVDEPKAQAVIDSVPPGDNVDYALEVQNTGIIRHYAIPGSTRCVQCHMGSPSNAFILGFTPLQIARLPAGTSGVIEPSAGDELTQLDRLIKYKVISGITSVDDILPLEKSEGTRTPRNDAELTAQAYMTGNCAHCHNPRGFPSTKAPELKNVLNFLPSATGGIFQFPLTVSSPVRARGRNQDVPIPYITPSLRDYPDPGQADKFFCPAQANGSCSGPPNLVSVKWIAAPWRSLIYRNVDTPFDYIEDRAIFPHMPLNTPGYDCRVPRIMGDWMVSIPSVVHSPALSLNAIADDLGNYPPNANNDPQPYDEVKPGDPGYADAVTAAGFRLIEYHNGLRYTYCADTSDIIDPVVADEVSRNLGVSPHTGYIPDPTNPNRVLIPDVGVPLRANWVVTDATEPPGDWFPRRPDWSTALVDHTAVGSGVSGDDLEDLKNVIAALQQLVLTNDVRAELTRQVPFGLWQAKAQCTQLAGTKTVASFTGADRAAWMNVTMPSTSAPVYSQSAGAAIFTSICFNCHGPQADAKGLLADEITLMTGGDARVADLRDGLFGPVGMAGSNRARVFGSAATMLGIGPDDVGARYLAWMALGGTAKHLPGTILDQVSLSPVLGQYRGPALELAGTPDMLRLGLKLCQEMLPGEASYNTLKMDKFLTTGWLDWGTQTGLIDRNGDAEMWLRLCNLNNRPVVRVLGGDNRVSATKLYWGDAYPATAPIMDQYGKVTNGIQPGNFFPLCNLNGQGPLVTNQQTGSAANVPACPASLFGNDAQNLLKVVETSPGSGVFDTVDARAWAARGAINAAAAVFLYLDGVAKGTIVPQPPYNQCEKL